MKHPLMLLIAVVAGMLDGMALTVTLHNDTVTCGSSVYTLGHGTYCLDGRPGADTSSPYAFSDPLQAIEAVNRAGSSATLLVAPWVYWLDDPDDPEVRRGDGDSGSTPFATHITVDRLHIIGLADDPRDVVFAVNRGQTQGALGNFTMLRFTGSEFTLENITLGNYCNVDLEYPANPSLNRPRRKDAIVQAQLGICRGTDKVFASNCRFISRLNLCPVTGARRTLYKDCYFECTDDALTGSAVYLDCRFTWYSSKPFYSTSPTGAVFLNCDIDLINTSRQYITKQPGVVTLIDTRFHLATQVRHPGTYELDWTRDRSATVCYQYNVTLDGEKYMVDASRPSLSVDLTDKPLLDAYKAGGVYNTPNLLAGDDGWDPLGIRPVIDSISRAMGRPLLGLPVKLTFDPDKIDMDGNGASVKLTPCYRRWGNYLANAPATGNALKWGFPLFVSLTDDGGGTVTCTDRNTAPVSASGYIEAYDEYGLRGSLSVTVPPLLKPAPKFAAAPALDIDKLHGVCRLSYQLTAGVDDCSRVTWYRHKNPDKTDTVAVLHGPTSVRSEYPLSRVDKDHYITAVVTPRGSDTFSGTPATATSGKVGKLDLIRVNRDQSSLHTDFSELPTGYQPVIGEGLWTWDAYKPADTSGHDWTPDAGRAWTYGNGMDAAARSTGLVQTTRGARMFYTPMRDGCKSMHVTLEIDPCKGAGQGFGSATGQYMDIYVMMDPVTLTGYALRIERTPENDRAVTFTLVKYDGGQVTPISEPAVSRCYRPTCIVDVDVTDGLLTATARRQPVETDEDDDTAGIDDAPVRLSARVTPLPYCSLGLQHTGSTGASASVIRSLDARWK